MDRTHTPSKNDSPSTHKQYDMTSLQIQELSTIGVPFQRGSVGGLNLQAFADADYASTAADRRLVSGGLVMCGGACVSWFSRTQKCVTLSTSEAEYVALFFRQLAFFVA